MRLSDYFRECPIWDNKFSLICELKVTAIRKEGLSDISIILRISKINKIIFSPY